MADSPKRVSISREATPQSPHVTTHPDLLALIGGGSDDDSEDDAILRPKGRLAARMQQQTRVQDSSNESGSEAERLAKSSKPTTETHEEDNEEDDDEVITTTRPRKLVPRRQQRSVTPESRPQERTGSASPGLFVSPTKPQSPAAEEDHDSASEDGLPTVASMAKKARLLALEAKKRKAREDKEAEEARKREERLAAQQAFTDDMDVDGDSEDNISDDDGGHRLTQKTGATRPAPRKASKKALEEMNRETQRLTRSLQLAHEVKVKKKINKSTLFERFNFKVPGVETTTSKTAEPSAAPASSSHPASPNSHHQTDAEDKDTPPSSPPAPSKDAEAGKEAAPAPSEAPQDSGLLSEDEKGDLPTLEAVLASSAAKPTLNKGKGKEIAIPKSKRNIRVKLPANTQVNAVDLTMDDDDDDLAILPTNKTKLDAVFDRVPVNQSKESRPMQMLRRLAHLDDPERKGAAPVTKKGCPKQTNQPAPMTVGELEMSLLQKARLQAKTERDRHLEMLRSKGIHVQTAEEREAELQEVEDIVSRARKEAEELMMREREAAKAERKARKDAGEVDALGWGDSDESGDEDYQDPEGAEKEGGGAGEEAELDLSGSEEEEEEEEEAEDVDMDEEEEEAEKQADPAGAFFDDAAGSAEESADEEAEDGFDDEDSDEEPSTARQPRRRTGKQRPVFLLDSEDDEGEKEKETPRKPAVEATPRPKANYPKSPSGLNTNESPNVPTSVLRSATKTFIPGLPVAGPAGLGLTQIFAGTMDDSQFGPGSVLGSPSQPMPTFQPSSAFTKMLNSRKSTAAAKSQTQKNAFGDMESSDFPDSNFSQTAQEVGEDMILDSQPNTSKETQNPETQGVQLRFSQSHMHGFDTFLEENHNSTQASELIEPTQDGGFHNFSPLKKRFVEQPDSTMGTVKLDEQSQEPQNESPLVRRTGKLRRKADLTAAAAARSRSPSRAPDGDEDMEGAEAAEQTDEFGFGTTSKGATTAFEVMKEAAVKEKKAKARAEFDKKKSKAREMVDAEAEESEDEYAGLGGVDGEDSDEDDGTLEEIIDDQTKTTESDERKLAALHADQERAADERQVDKLFRDITTGMLRRKRGGDWDDISDDDDGGEARRRMKRQQFAKMQRALFADERISKVAENPRNQAFLRTIEDHGSDDDMDFLFAPPPPGPGVDSQDSQSEKAGTVIPDSQPQAGTGTGIGTTERRIANPRRSKPKEGKKPSNIGEIRESLSNLLEDPSHSSSVIPATVLDSDEDEEMDDDLKVEPPTERESSSAASSDKENRNPRRGRVAIVDRISLKRNSSSVSSASGSGDRLAFATASSSSGSFKVPALLRKATTNSLMGGGTSSTTTSSTARKDTTTSSGNGSGSVFGEDAKIKKTTTTSKRSGINYFARENERRAALAENERRREARKWKGAEGRGKVVGSLFGAGKFE